MLGQGAIGQFVLGQPEDGGQPVPLPVVGVAVFDVDETASVAVCIDTSADTDGWVKTSAEIHVWFEPVADIDVDLRILQEVV